VDSMIKILYPRWQKVVAVVRTKWNLIFL
jgi:hypothetical protein